MSVHCPPCQWPEVLRERGPSEDPALLLTGTAHVGEVAMQIVAIRIHPTLRSTPDRQGDLAQDTPEAGEFMADLEAILEEFEYTVSEFAELLGESHSSVVELATGRYRLWMVPASFDWRPTARQPA